jgi:hypothetical protein
MLAHAAQPKETNTMSTHTASGLALTFALALVVYPHTQASVGGFQRVADPQADSSTTKQAQTQAKAPGATASSQQGAKKQHIDGADAPFNAQVGEQWRKKQGLDSTNQK